MTEHMLLVHRHQDDYDVHSPSQMTQLRSIECHCFYRMLMDRLNHLGIYKNSKNLIVILFIKIKKKNSIYLRVFSTFLKSSTNHSRRYSASVLPVAISLANNWNHCCTKYIVRFIWILCTSCFIYNKILLKNINKRIQRIYAFSLFLPHPEISHIVPSGILKSSFGRVIAWTLSLNSSGFSNSKREKS